MKWQHIPFGAVIANAGIVALLGRILTIIKLSLFAKLADYPLDGVLRGADITNEICAVVTGL